MDPGESHPEVNQPDVLCAADSWKGIATEIEMLVAEGLSPRDRVSKNVLAADAARNI